MWCTYVLLLVHRAVMLACCGLWDRANWRTALVWLKLPEQHVAYLRSAAYISCSDGGVLRIVGRGTAPTGGRALVWLK